MRRESRLIIIDVNDVNTKRASARQLWRTLVGGDDRQPVEVTDFTIQHNVGLDYAGEWRFNHECVVVITVHDMIDRVGIGARISIGGRYLNLNYLHYLHHVIQ